MKKEKEEKRAIEMSSMWKTWNKDKPGKLRDHYYHHMSYRTLVIMEENSRVISRQRAFKSVLCVLIVNYTPLFISAHKPQRMLLSLVLKETKVFIKTLVGTLVITYPDKLYITVKFKIKGKN